MAAPVSPSTQTAQKNEQKGGDMSDVGHYKDGVYVPPSRPQR